MTCNFCGEKIRALVDPYLFRRLIRNLINITINIIHTITSPNSTIPVAPNTDTLNTTNAISNNNVNTKIKNVIINTNLLSITGVAFFAEKRKESLLTQSFELMMLSP